MITRTSVPALGLQGTGTGPRWSTMTGLDPQQNPPLASAQSRLAVQRTEHLLGQTRQVVAASQSCCFASRVLLARGAAPTIV